MTEPIDRTALIALINPWLDQLAAARTAARTPFNTALASIMADRLVCGDLRPETIAWHNALSREERLEVFWALFGKPQDLVAIDFTIADDGTGIVTYENITPDFTLE